MKTVAGDLLQLALDGHFDVILIGNWAKKTTPL